VTARLLWWVALFGLWVLLVGTKDELELLAGACAAVLGVVAVEAVRSQGLLRFEFRKSWLVSALKPLARVLPDYVIVLRVLVGALRRRGRTRGAFRAVPFDAGGDTPLGAGRRAFVTAAGSIAPNALVVDVDRERNLLLVHELDPAKAPDTPL
jgi:multisubunit Na+/H+ antiporter MnhE subunit